jgi:hypothetical protein
MREHGYKAEFIEGHEWVQTKDDHQSPFLWIEDLYKERQRIKDADPSDIRQMAIKMLINSTYGKTAQQKPTITDLTNFMYASYITAGVRLRMASIAKEYYDNVIQISTDGILLDRRIDLPISKDLGDWEESHYEKVLVIGSGIYQAFTDNGKSFTKARGFTNDRAYNLLAHIQKDKYKEKIEYHKRTPLPLFMVLAEAMFKPTDMNVFKDRIRELDVNTDKKRNWDRRCKNFKDLLDNPINSKPLSVKDVDTYY